MNLWDSQLQAFNTFLQQQGKPSRPAWFERQSSCLSTFVPPANLYLHDVVLGEQNTVLGATERGLFEWPACVWREPFVPSPGLYPHKVTILDQDSVGGGPGLLREFVDPSNLTSVAWLHNTSPPLHVPRFCVTSAVQLKHKLYFCAGTDGSVVSYNLNTSKEVFKAPSLGSPITALRSCQDHVYVVTLDGVVAMCAHTGNVLHRVPPLPSPVTALDVNPSGCVHHLALGTLCGGVYTYTWNMIQPTITGRLRTVWSRVGSAVRHVSLHALCVTSVTEDGMLLSGSQLDGSVSVRWRHAPLRRSLGLRTDGTNLVVYTPHKVFWWHSHGHPSVPRRRRAPRQGGGDFFPRALLRT